MSLHRRRILRTASVATLAAFAGCATAADVIGSSDPAQTYALSVEDTGASPADYALYYSGDDDSLDGETATALERIIPDGRYTTFGYRALPDGEYVERDGTYYRLESVVTGRERKERTLVRADPLAEGTETPDDATKQRSAGSETSSHDALHVDSLERPTARIIEILRIDSITDGESGVSDLLRGDAYVLRRPDELESALAAGELDGRVVTVTEGGPGYRVRTSTETVVETAYTALAIPVADSREAFREVVFGSSVDVELTADDLSESAQEILSKAVARDTYEETAPLSGSYETLLDALGLGDVEEFANGRLLWYEGTLYRCALYVNEAS